MTPLRLTLATLAALALPASAIAAQPWEDAIASALGKAGTEMPGGVYRVGLPRSDLHVVVDGVALKPSLALGSWVGFMRMGRGNSVMLMGDLVRTEDDVKPGMKRLIDRGIEITALHNHLLSSTPHTMYMHIAGHGDGAALAGTIHAALALSKTPFPAAGASAPAAAAAPLDLDTAALDNALSAKGKDNGGVYAFTISRSPPPREGGMAIPDAMGGAIAINFQPTGNGRAAIAGDLVLTANEVNPVLRSLRASGIEVEALHNHMLDDQPRLFFMHFWANDDALKLARGLRAALDLMAVKR
jgi:biotin operon repressor